jgi:hypothetical protein
MSERITQPQEPTADGQPQDDSACVPPPSATRDFSYHEAAQETATPPESYPQEGLSDASQPIKPQAEAPKTPTLPKATTLSEGKGDSSEPSSGKGMKTDFTDIKTGMVFVVDGSANLHFGESADKLVPSGQAEQEAKPETKSLFEVTTELNLTDVYLPEELSAEAGSYLEVLRKERFLLISCLDEEIAQAAAHTLMQKLDVIEEDRRRLLNFEKYKEGFQYNDIHSFWQMHIDEEQPMAVLLDTFSEQGGTFIGSLLMTAPSSSGEVKQQLSHTQIFMLCIANPRRVAQSSGGNKKLRLPHWEIPFLQTVLSEYAFDQRVEIERRILRQRERGDWSEIDGDFCSEVKSLIKAGKLREEIEAREKSPGSKTVEELFQDWNDLRGTVLYVAAFFPNLYPPEFKEVVERLLGERTTTINDKILKQGEGGVSEVVEVPREKALAELWRETQRELFKAFHLRSVSSRGSGRAIGFEDMSLRVKIREQMEREYSFDLNDQFLRLQKAYILFHPSPRVAEGMTKITAGMMTMYPDYYGEEWLSQMIEAFERRVAHDDLGVLKSVAPTFAEPNVIVITQELFYKRVSDLLRTLLEDTPSPELVEKVLRQLMSRKLYNSVLKIIEKLQFAPAFNELKWVKQLLEQGNIEARARAEDYLYNYLKMFGGRIYQVLCQLDSWLPEEASAPYPARAALRLLVAYCFETVARFSPEDYGSWPTTYRLLAFKTAEAAETNLRLLVRWLFHPETGGILEERGIEGSRRYELLIVWSFILFGKGTEERSGDASLPPRSSARAPAEDATAATQINAAAVQEILLQLVVEATVPAQQKEMLAYWEALNRLMLADIKVLPYTSPLRNELIWKRNQLSDFMTQFKAQREQAGARR